MPLMHSLSGKASAHSVRTHLLVDAALNALFLADAFQVSQIFVHQEVQTAMQENERNGEGRTVIDFAFPPLIPMLWMAGTSGQGVGHQSFTRCFWNHCVPKHTFCTCSRG